MRHNKLVRDNIPAICEQNGAISVTRTLGEEEYTIALDKKLQEEVAEYLAENNLEELADILEVVYAIAEQKGSGQVELEALRREKADKRGDFKGRVFLVETREAPSRGRKP